jgi:hypothetical protein
MKIIEPGHIYELNWLDGKPKEYHATQDMPDHDLIEYFSSNRLIFVNREKGTEHPGTQTQEVLRALIDRTQHCDNCLRWEGNDQIIYHLRMALALHEARAILRKTEKGYIHPEEILIGPDGHFTLGNKL